MNLPRTISFKSIPSFIIFLPIISLILVTFIIIYITHDIKDEMIDDGKKTILLKHFDDQKNGLKVRVDQIIQEIKSFNDYEIIAHTDAMPRELNIFLDSISRKQVQSDKNRRNTISLFNKSDIYHYDILSKKALLARCDQLATSACFNSIKSGAGFFIEDQRPSNHFQKKVFVKKIPTSTSYATITLDIKILSQTISRKMINIISNIAIKKDEFVYILNESGDLFQAQHKEHDHQIFHTKGTKDFLLKHLNLANSDETFFQLKSPDDAASLEPDLYYTKRYRPLNWIVTAQKKLTTLDTALVDQLEAKTSYFNSRINELTLIIILVASIIIIASFLIARTMSHIFKRFRKHIIEQNKKLKGFNRRLSLKVKEQSSELNKSEARYRTIFESSRDAIFIIEDEIITYCNESALKMFKRNLKSTLINTSLFDLFPILQPDGNNSQKLLQDYLAITQSLGHTRFEWLVRKSDGTTFFVDVLLQDIELEGKETFHVVFRDIDAQKKAQGKIKEQHKELISLNENLEERVMHEIDKNKKKEQLLLQQSRLAQMGEMISMIAHQWRQPLSAISTSSAHLKLLIDLGDHNDDLLIEGLSNVDLYVTHLSQTIDDFRNFFKPDKHKEETTLDELITKSLSIINTSLEGNNITVIFNDKNDQIITLYSHEVMQVILNIIKNSEDILLERKIQNPFIEIRCYEDPKNFYITFEDNAAGIHNDILDRVFDPYFSTKNDKNGTGMGLYMSKVIIKDHCKGELTVTNTQNGAMFTISLPKEQ